MPTINREQKVLRWFNLGLLLVGIFFVVILFAHSVRFDLLFIRFSCTGRKKPLVLLAVLYAARQIYVILKQKDLPLSPVGYLQRDLPLLLFVMSLTMFAALRNRMIVNIHHSTEEQAYCLTGDEPSYMMMCQSVVLDGDVNLWNDARKRGGALFGDKKAGPHKARRDMKLQRVYSIHSVGLPLLLSPFFNLALRTGLTPRFACASAVNVLAALFLVLTYYFTCLLCRNRWISFGVALLVAASCPLLVYASQIYPGLPAGFLVVSALLLIMRPTAESRSSELVQAFLTGLCMALLPWLNIRFGILSLAIFLTLLIYKHKRYRYLAAAVAPSVLSAALLMLFYNKWYGSPWPNAGYVAQGWKSTATTSVPKLLHNLTGVFADNGTGLLTWSPYFAFVPAGIWFCFRKNRNAAITVLIGMGLYLAVVAAFPLWWGGFSPPNRYMVSVMPLLAVSLVCFLQHNTKKLPLLVFLVLAAVSVFFVNRAAYGNLELLYRKRHILQTVPLASLPSIKALFTPSIVRSDPLALYNAIMYLVIVFLLNIYAVVPGSRQDLLKGERTTHGT